MAKAEEYSNVVSSKKINSIQIKYNDSQYTIYNSLKKSVIDEKVIYISINGKYIIYAKDNYAAYLLDSQTCKSVKMSNDFCGFYGESSKKLYFSRYYNDSKNLCYYDITTKKTKNIAEDVDRVYMTADYIAYDKYIGNKSSYDLYLIKLSNNTTEKLTLPAFGSLKGLKNEYIYYCSPDGGARSDFYSYNLKAKTGKYMMSGESSLDEVIIDSNKVFIKEYLSSLMDSSIYMFNLDGSKKVSVGEAYKVMLKGKHIYYLNRQYAGEGEFSGERIGRCNLDGSGRVYLTKFKDMKEKYADYSPSWTVVYKKYIK
ncbi:hypothetical protein [Anaerocolumna xylanovorans]|uniref:hypothetical protein n=1 Tax=Anaerocolumna xylanovorans TaxID=100134 RepID=UPI001114858F|nr:hypothetical protein [Anaerocolumna xylanovorans]